MDLTRVASAGLVLTLVVIGAVVLGAGQFYGGTSSSSSSALTQGGNSSSSHSAASSTVTGTSSASSSSSTSVASTGSTAGTVDTSQTSVSTETTATSAGSTTSTTIPPSSQSSTTAGSSSLSTASSTHRATYTIRSTTTLTIPLTTSNLTETTTATISDSPYFVYVIINYYRSCYGCTYYGVLGVYQLVNGLPEGPCLEMCLSGTFTTNHTEFGVLNCNVMLSYYFVDYSEVKSMDFEFGFINGTIIYSANPTDSVMGTWSPPCTTTTATITYTTTTISYTTTTSTITTTFTPGIVGPFPTVTIMAGFLAVIVLMIAPSVLHMRRESKEGPRAR